MTDIHWKPMTGGRWIPSILPCITVEEYESQGEIRYRYKELNKHAFKIKSWTSEFGPPQSMMWKGVPIIRIEDIPND